MFSQITQLILYGNNYLEICPENVFCRMALDIGALKELGTG